MLLKLLKKIDKKEYLTKEEHESYLKELEFMAKLFDDLTIGNMISYHGDFIAMNKKKYYEYRDKQLVSAEAVAFTQQRNEELEKVFRIFKEKPFESASAINYIKINKDNPKMLNYEHYCMTIKDKVNESEFVLLCEVVKHE